MTHVIMTRVILIGLDEGLPRMYPGVPPYQSEASANCPGTRCLARSGFVTNRGGGLSSVPHRATPTQGPQATRLSERRRRLAMATANRNSSSGGLASVLRVPSLPTKLAEWTGTRTPPAAPDVARQPSGTVGAPADAGLPRLTYFNARGRAEVVRIMCAEAAFEFEDYRFRPNVENECRKPEDHRKLNGEAAPVRQCLCQTHGPGNDEFVEFKASGKSLTGQVPLMEIDGISLVQTSAICRYLATKFGMNGHTDVERAYIDIVAATLDDLYIYMVQSMVNRKVDINFYLEQWPKVRPALALLSRTPSRARAPRQAGARARALTRCRARRARVRRALAAQVGTTLEQMAEQYSPQGGHFVGTKLTWVDIYGFHMFQRCARKNRPFFSPPNKGRRESFPSPFRSAERLLCAGRRARRRRARAAPAGCAAGAVGAGPPERARTGAARRVALTRDTSAPARPGTCARPNPTPAAPRAAARARSPHPARRIATRAAVSALRPRGRRRAQTSRRVRARARRVPAAAGHPRRGGGPAAREGVAGRARADRERSWKLHRLAAVIAISRPPAAGAGCGDRPAAEDGASSARGCAAAG